MFLGFGWLRRGGRQGGAGDFGRDADFSMEALEPRLMLAGDFAVTVLARTTNDTTPTLTGTVENANATVYVTVYGSTYTATKTGPTAWSVNVTNPLPEGVHDVQVQAIDTVDGKIATDDTTDELTIDLTAPVVTVDVLSTTSTSPLLTGTVDDADATIAVTVNGVQRLATNNGDGTWTLAAGSLPALPSGVYDVQVQALDLATNEGTDETSYELAINDTLVVTFDDLAVNDSSPLLIGTVTDSTASISVNVNGADYVAVNNGDNTWTLSDGSIAALDDGEYLVTVTAAVGLDEASDTGTLTVDTVAPTVAFDLGNLHFETAVPTLTGTVSEPDATVTVQIQYDLEKYAATNHGDGTWTITLPAQLDGVYDIFVEATDPAGNVGSELLAAGLTVDLVPVVTVDTLTSSNTSPQLTGTVNDPDAVIQVTVGGNSYFAVNNGDAVRGAAGTWTLPAGTISPALEGGTYDVHVTATDAGGKIGTDTTTNELTIGVALTVDTLVTADRRPPLTGTVDDPDATIRVTVNSRTYTAVNNGDGTWTLPGNTIPPVAALPDGVYAVTVTGENTATGLTGEVTAAGALTVDITGPSVLVFRKTTSDRTPEINGTVQDERSTVAEITVAVAGQSFSLSGGQVTYDSYTNLWTLPGGTLAELAPGIYNVVVTATDSLGNSRSDTTTGELVIPIVVTVDELITNNSMPDLTGTVDDPDASIAVTVNGRTFTAINNGDGTWMLPGSDMVDRRGLPLPLPDGTYDVTATATLGNATGTDDTTDELTVDTTAPVVTVDPLTTNDPSPPLTGTVSEPGAFIQLIVNGQVFDSDNHILVNDDGTWTLLDDVVSPLGLGTYDVQVTATDEAGNVGTDDTVDELSIVNNPSVDRLVTNDTTPPLTGRVWDPLSVTELTVQVLGQTFSLLGGQLNVDADTGVWTLGDDMLTALAEGVYDVVVTASYGAVQVSDLTTGELVIDLTPPVVTVGLLTTTYTSPAITGTVSDPQGIASLTVRVGAGTTYSLADHVELDRTTGVWTLPAGLLSLVRGQNYDVVVTATDQAGNVGTDITTDELRVVQQTVITLGTTYIWSSITFMDPDGTRVTLVMRRLPYSLATAILVFNSNSVITETTRFAHMRVLTADAGISLSSIHFTADVMTFVINTRGGTVPGTTIGNVIGSTAEVNVFRALTTDVTGSINMSDGAIFNLLVGNVYGGDITMTGRSRRAVSIIVLGDVQDSNIVISDMSVRSFMCGRFINSSLMVGVHGMTDANGDGVIDLPVPENLREGQRLARFIVRGVRGAEGDSFVNSNIAAHSITSVLLRDAQLNNAGVSFGISANEIRLVRLLQGRTPLIYPRRWDEVIDLLDMTVRLPQA